MPMENLFSHPAASGADEPGTPADVDPVVYAVVVPGSVSRAFIGFTEHTHLWWPMESNSVFGAGSYVEFEENLILETADRSEEHTSELQSQSNLVCRLLLEKKKTILI